MFDVVPAGFPKHDFQSKTVSGKDTDHFLICYHYLQCISSCSQCERRTNKDRMYQNISATTSGTPTNHTEDFGVCPWTKDGKISAPTTPNL